MNRAHYSYILASKPRGAIYVGTAQDLVGVVEEHKANVVEGLTSLYAIHLLVYFERFDTPGQALLRTQALKSLGRGDKIRLIERHNQYWRDLHEDLLRQTREASATLA